jgi:hypothetical protein
MTELNNNVEYHEFHRRSTSYEHVLGVSVSKIEWLASIFSDLEPTQSAVSFNRIDTFSNLIRNIAVLEKNVASTQRRISKT